MSLVTPAALATPDAAWKLAPSAAAAWRRGAEKGLALLDEALAAAKDPAPLHALRAEARAAAGRYSQAVEDAEAAVRLTPEDPAARAALARALARAGRLEEASAAAEQAFAAAPGTAWLAAEKALLLLARGRAGQALSAAREAAALDGADPAAALALAAALARNGQAAEALSALGPALKAGEGFGLGAPAPQPLALRADLLAHEGRWKEAASARAEAAKAGLSPAWPQPRDLEAALAGLASLKQDAWTRAWRGQLLAEAGRDEEAHAELSAALKSSRSHKPARAWRARLNAKLGRLKEALADAKAAGGMTLLEGDLLAALGKGREAAAAYARAAKEGPERAQARLRRGLVLEALGKKSEASLELSKALEGDPSLKQAYEARARIRRERGDATGAASDAARAAGAPVPKTGARDPETDQGPGEGPKQRRLGRMMVDGRLELAGLLQTKLTGAPVPDFCREKAPEMAAYVDEALAKFGPQLDMGLVDAFGRTATARANPDFPWFAIAQMMMGLSELPELRPHTTATWRHGEDLRFLEALRRFVARTRFDRWVASKKPLYARWTARLRPLVEREAYAESVAAYVGREVNAYYDVVLTPLLRGARIRAILLDDAGARGARTVMGPLSSPEELEDCLLRPDQDALLWTGWHEHLHTLLDPWTGLYEPEAARFETLYATLPRMAKRKNWMDSFSEHHVRAVTQRMLLLRRGKKAQEKLAETDRKEGYRFTDALTAALEPYEKDRKKWPTLLDYLPTWLKTWESFT